MRQQLTSRVLALSLVAAGLASSLLPVTAGAAVVFQDLFATDGNLAGVNGWYAHSGAGAKPIVISNGKFTLQQSALSGEDVNHPFAAQPNNAKTYMSFTLTVPAGSVMGSANDYFIHFRPAPTDTLNFVTRVFVGPPTAGGDYVIGVGSGSLTSTPLATWGSGLSFGTTYRVVAAYDAVTGASQLWIAPTNEGSTSVATAASAPVAAKPLGSVAVRQASPTGATRSEIIGEITVATSFDDTIVVVPGATEWGLSALAALLVLAGARFALRRREVTA